MATILVVDDHPVHLRMYGYTLRKHGYMVATAVDGQDALHVLATTAVDLVLTDLAMPVMDGLNLLKHLRADARFATLPVIMLTASGLDEDRISADSNGVDAFLTKPMESRELVATVERLLLSP